MREMGGIRKGSLRPGGPGGPTTRGTGWEVQVDGEGLPREQSVPVTEPDFGGGIGNAPHS